MSFKDSLRYVGVVARMSQNNSEIHLVIISGQNEKNLKNKK
jgi:hypothetical protein